MSIGELPLGTVNSVRRVLMAAVSSAKSPFTFSGQVQDWGGRQWSYDIGFAVEQGAAGRRLSAFFAALGGAAEPFIFRDPMAAKPATGSAPVVNGAGQSGRALETVGWTGSGLSAGDFFSIGSGAGLRLYQLTADVVPVAGAAQLQFVPALRSSPANGAALEIHAPGVVLELTGEVPADIGLGALYQFSITAVEAL